MARRLPPERPLRRHPSYVQPVLKLVVFCEGRNTEPNYLRSFAFEHGNKVVELILVPAAGVPMTLVRAAVDENSRLQALAKKSPDSYDARFQVWALFDFDEHPKVREALQVARQNKVAVAMSNPCFELWAVLHLQDQDAEIHRHAIQKLLRKLMPKYDYRGKVIDYETIAPYYDDACRRARLICKRRIEENNPQGNPSTNVHELMAVIVENGVRRG